jgi:hypothetical protein
LLAIPTPPTTPTAADYYLVKLPLLEKPAALAATTDPFSNQNLVRVTGEPGSGSGQ